MHRIRCRWQATVLSALRERARPALELRLRHKMERWPKPIFARVATDRVVRLLPRVSRMAPPRLAAAFLRTLFNGWPTCRRFQQHGECRFGCPGAEDSIEHYAACGFVRSFGKSFLNLPDVLEPLADRIARFVSLGTWHLVWQSDGWRCRQAAGASVCHVQSHADAPPHAGLHSGSGPPGPATVRTKGSAISSQSSSTLWLVGAAACSEWAVRPGSRGA